MKYNGFISYSHQADQDLAPSIQSGLERFAKPWHKLRALDIYRDQTDLGATPHLWKTIQEALDNSEFLILMASPGAAKSAWVEKEVEHWLENKSLDTLIVVLTEGVIVWDESINDFGAQTNALPQKLYDGVFEMEIKYLDFTMVKNSADRSLHNPIFADKIVEVASILHKESKKNLAGKDVKEHKRLILLRNAALTLLSILLITSLIVAFIAVQKGREANKNFEEAENQKAIAVDRGNRLESQLIISDSLYHLSEEKKKELKFEKIKSDTLAAKERAQRIRAEREKQIALSNFQLAQSSIVLANDAKNNKIAYSHKAIMKAAFLVYKSYESNPTPTNRQELENYLDKLGTIVYRKKINGAFISKVDYNLVGDAIAFADAVDKKFRINLIDLETGKYRYQTSRKYGPIRTLVQLNSMSEVLFSHNENGYGVLTSIFLDPYSGQRITREIYKAPKGYFIETVEVDESVTYCVLRKYSNDINVSDQGMLMVRSQKEDGDYRIIEHNLGELDPFYPSPKYGFSNSHKQFVCSHNKTAVIWQVGKTTITKFKQIELPEEPRSIDLSVKNTLVWMSNENSDFWVETLNDSGQRRKHKIEAPTVPYNVKVGDFDALFSTSTPTDYQLVGLLSTMKHQGKNPLLKHVLIKIKPQGYMHGIKEKHGRVIILSDNNTMTLVDMHHPRLDKIQAMSRQAILSLARKRIVNVLTAEERELYSVN